MALILGIRSRMLTAAFVGTGAVAGAAAFVAIGTPWYQHLDGISVESMLPRPRRVRDSPHRYISSPPGGGPRIGSRMSRNLVTVLGVIAAVVIAWFLVDFALHFIYLVFRLVLVAIVAVIVSSGCGSCSARAPE